MRPIWRSLSHISLGIGAATFTLPALAAECGSLPLLTTLDLNIARGGVPIVDAMIADKPVHLLVDTGAAASVLTKRTVRELGLSTSTAGVELRTVNGQKANFNVRLPSIVLGRVRQEGVYFMILPGEDNPSDTSPQVFDGLLGADFLANVDLDFDFAAKKLNIVSQNHCAGKVVYWQAPALAIIPMTINQSGHIVFRMELDGRKLNAMLDTGASTTNLNLNTARQAFKVDVNSPDVEKIGELTGGGYAASVYRRRFKSIAFEGVTIANPMVNLLPDLISGATPGASRTGSIVREDREPEVILGMSTLSQLHLYIAYKERKVYITAAAPAPAAGSAPSAQ